MAHRRNCRSKKRDGTPCRRPAQRSSDVCWSHDETRKAREREKTGVRRDPYPPVTVADLKNKFGLFRRIRRLPLPGMHKHFLCTLVEHANVEDARCYPSADKLAAQLSVGRRTIQKWKKRLASLGFLTWTNTGRTSSYTIHLPREVFTPDGNGGSDLMRTGIHTNRKETEREKEDEGSVPSAANAATDTSPSRDEADRLSEDQAYEWFWWESERSPTPTVIVTSPSMLIEQWGWSFEEVDRFTDEGHKRGLWVKDIIWNESREEDWIFTVDVNAMIAFG